MSTRKGLEMANEITIFSKRKVTSDGVVFYTYVARLPRLDGSFETVGVKFSKPCTPPDPVDCPCNIIVNRDLSNLATNEYTDRNTGERKSSKTLWVGDWAPGSPYEDHSLDDYAI